MTDVRLAELRAKLEQAKPQAEQWTTTLFLVFCTTRQRKACTHDNSHQIQRCISCVCKEGDELTTALDESLAEVEQLKAEVSLLKARDCGEVVPRETQAERD